MTVVTIKPSKYAFPERIESGSLRRAGNSSGYRKGIEALSPTPALDPQRVLSRLSNVESRIPLVTRTLDNGEVVHSLHRVSCLEELEAGRLSERYSEFKFGASAQIRNFSARLMAGVHKVLGSEITAHRENWAVASAPYHLVPPASNKLGEFIARGFFIPSLDLRSRNANKKPDVHRPYAALATREERIDSRREDVIFLSGESPIEGRDVIVVDDLTNTGTLIQKIGRILTSTYGARHIHYFSLISMETDSLALEDWVNTHLLRLRSAQRIVALLDDPSSYINRHTIKQLFRYDRDFFDEIILLVSAQTRQRIHQLATQYFINPPDEETKSRLEALE